MVHHQLLAHLSPHSEHGGVILELDRDNTIHPSHVIDVTPFLPDGQAHQVPWHIEPLLKETGVQLPLLLLGYLQ